MNILLVEDDERFLNEISVVVSDLIVDLKLDVSDNLNDAKNFINSNNYDIVILDHNIFIRKGGQIADNVGYSLIPQIRSRNSKTIIIGTSSEGERELNRYKSALDYQIDFDQGYNKQTGVKAIMPVVLEQIARRS